LRPDQILATSKKKEQMHFWLNDDSNNSTFSRISTNGDVTDTRGNGIDLLVYAGVVPTLPPVPEPPLYALMAVGFAAMGWLQRRRLQAR
jgi:hypothetical protein